MQLDIPVRHHSFIFKIWCNDLRHSFLKRIGIKLYTVETNAKLFVKQLFFIKSLDRSISPELIWHSSIAAVNCKRTCVVSK